jgi:hypothetical protein
MDLTLPHLTPPSWRPTFHLAIRCSLVAVRYPPFPGAQDREPRVLDFAEQRDNT